MTETRKLRVFLCHASQDKTIVRELYQRLNAEGWIDPWLDEEKLLPGQDWDLEIGKAVESADVIIVCLSSTSISKEGYVQKEIKTALNVALFMPEESIYIVPLRLNDCSIPRNLRSIQYVDFFPNERKERMYVRLFQSLKIRLGQVITRDLADLARKEKKRPELNKFVNDTRRDAGKYYKLLLAIENATGKIHTLEKTGRTSIDDVLAGLLPDLVDALDAAQAFVAQPGARNHEEGFEVIAVYPKIGSSRLFLPQSKFMNQVLSDGKARVVESGENAPQRFIKGLEIFQALTAVIVGMQIEEQPRIIGVCNRSSPEMGPFLATDRRTLDGVIKLIAIGLRAGERRK